MYRHWGSVQAVRPIGGVEVYLWSFMTTALERCEGSASSPGRSLPRERHGTHCTGGWVGSRVGLDRCGKSRLPPRFDSRTVQPVASHYTDWATRPCLIGAACLLSHFVVKSGVRSYSLMYIFQHPVFSYKSSTLISTLVIRLLESTFFPQFERLSFASFQMTKLLFRVFSIFTFLDRRQEKNRHY